MICVEKFLQQRCFKKAKALLVNEKMFVFLLKTFLFLTGCCKRCVFVPMSAIYDVPYEIDTLERNINEQNRTHVPEKLHSFLSC
jgi:cell division protein FtsL